MFQRWENNPLFNPVFRSFAADKNNNKSSSNVMIPRQDSENISMFSQALGRVYPVLAAFCFHKHDSTSLLPRPGGKKQGEAFGARLSATDKFPLYVDSSSTAADGYTV